MREYVDILRLLRHVKANDTVENRQALFSTLLGTRLTYVLGHCLLVAATDGVDNWKVMLDHTIKVVEHAERHLRGVM